MIKIKGPFLSFLLIIGLALTSFITYKIVFVEGKIKRIPYEAAIKLETKLKKRPRIANRKYRRALGNKIVYKS